MKPRHLILVVLAVTAAAQESPYVAELQAGRALFQAGKYEDALTHFARARKLVPTDWRGHAYQALTHVQMALGERDRVRRLAFLREADAVASDLVKKDKAGLGFSDPLYKYLRGLILSVGGQDQRAYEVLSGAVRLPRSRFRPYAEMRLHESVRLAYAKTAVHMATRFIRIAQFDPAAHLLYEADPHLPEDDPERVTLERHLAVICERHGRLDEAVVHLRKCIELRPAVREELLGTMAIIYMEHEKEEKAREILKEAPADSKDADVVAARCMMVYKRALTDPASPTMDEALRYYRAAMKDYPVDEVYRLVEQYAELVLAKVGPRERDKEKPLLLSTLALLEREIQRRPECASLYFKCYRIHKLLGNKKEEIRYQELHDQKKKEWEHKENYDERGRPRCR